MQITIYSTCQGEAIKFYLTKYFPTGIFSVIRNYYLVLHNNINDLQSFRQLLNNTSIFIYQEMPAKFGIYSTDLSVENNILSYLPDNCIKIIIPYVYADWYWGLIEVMLGDATPDFDKIDQETLSQIKYINKDVILNLKSKYDLDTIINLYDNNEIDFKYDERMKTGINILKIKEQSCDIKVSDYILQNYKINKLFHMPNHPSHLVIKEMTKQILKKLNIDYSMFDREFENNNYNLGCDVPFSKYDQSFHNFEFKPNCDDAAIKDIIKRIYKFS
jgi:hypothetical protein